MIYAIVFYWFVCGFAFFALPTPSSNRLGIHSGGLGEFVVCMVLGGIAIPARILIKAVN